MNTTETCRIRPAVPEEAAAIARLIMMAMTDECCLHFCGEGHGLEDFRRMMTALVERTDTQYAYTNALVAVSRSADGHKDDNEAAGEDEFVMGASVSYDGGRLHELRRAFIEAANQQLGKDNSGMADETEAGELYLDSFAVMPEWRGRGIGTQLLRATAERARSMGLPRVGLLVDTGNPSAERLYRGAGFRCAGENRWGGHAMRHLVMDV